MKSMNMYVKKALLRKIQKLIKRRRKFCGYFWMEIEKSIKKIQMTNDANEFFFCKMMAGKREARRGGSFSIHIFYIFSYKIQLQHPGKKKEK